MQISTEGKIQIALSLLGLAGGGVVMIAPQQVWIGWVMIAAAVIGFVLLALHHRGYKFRSPITKGDTSSAVIFPPTVTASLPTLQEALYVCDMRFTFSDLKDRHSELTMRVFNGTGRIVEFSGLISGRIKFSAPNNTDPLRTGELPTPALRPDTERTVAQLKEWLLILTQRVPAVEADKLVAMLETDIPILFDLSELMIGVFAQDDRNNVERLPIWSGVSYSRGYGFGMIISGTMNVTEGCDKMRGD